MKVALRSGSSAPLIRIEDWLIHNRNNKATCPVCGEEVLVRGALSTQVTPHFAHHRGSNCPTLPENSKPFDIFTRVARGSQDDARRLKEYTFQHLESIYERCRHLCPGLTWKELLALLERANDHDIWSFRGFNPGYTPYVLLCCADLFPGHGKAPRSHDIFFVLEPSAGTSDYWHLRNIPRRSIWRITRSSPLEIVPFEMSEAEIDPWYRAIARKTLKI
ncbi:MAG: hypothetical protein J0L89_05625 [Xanthomonadales bacterium]|nr:hypothetical protein [Xanthomonadales bacterium]